MSTVPTVALEGAENSHPLLDRHPSDPLLDLPIRPVGQRIESCSDQLHLRIRVEVGQVDHRCGLHRLPRREPVLRQLGQSFLHVRVVPTYLIPPVGEVDPFQKRRDHFPEFGQHQICIGTGLRERMGPHPDQEGLVGLAGAVDPYV